MLDEEKLDEIFKNNQEFVEEKISKQYHERLKQIKEQNFEERENIKQGIIAEMYYKEGFKDGIDYVLRYLKIDLST